MPVALTDQNEWLEADGLGGFASGTVTGVRTRRYHGLLLVATTPPTGRLMLANGFDAWLETAAGRVALSTQQYGPDVRHPDGDQRIAAFAPDPWPTWTFRLEDGGVVEHEIFVPRDVPAVVMAWRLKGARRRGGRLLVRPFLSGRDIHALHHENPAFRFDAERTGARVIWRPYEGLPAIVAAANGSYAHEPDWFRNFLYAEERNRGLDFTEDLAAPGTFSWDLAKGEAWIVLGARLPGGEDPLAAVSAAWVRRVRTAERRRRAAFPTRLHRAADAYLVRRGQGKTVVAGYPWFTDWGRDTFISLRGLCIATGRLDEAREILLGWAGAVSEGMLPNRFVEQGDVPEFNSVDAALWYVVAVRDALEAMRAAKRRLPARERRALEEAVQAILAGYARGTRHGIRMDEDGLLAAGEPGVQLTWMDAKVGDWVVTPRIGKPVEVQALWLNALAVGRTLDARWAALFERGRRSFGKRFWNADGGWLYDVVDADHRPGAVDPALRPNQIFAIGGLPVPLLEGDRARRVVDAVESRLWTPLGLRSLAPGEPGYAPRYEGGVLQRDGAYHQGTVWPWLAGAFVEAWLRVRGNTAAARREASPRFLAPLLAHLDEAGLGHVSEIADAEPPHTPRGCPFQAWSVGEALRVAAALSGADGGTRRRPRRRVAAGR
jgi:predicted glycogen debranching enzyme